MLCEPCYDTAPCINHVHASLHLIDRADVFLSACSFPHVCAQRATIVLLLLDIASGLEYLHSRNIVHGGECGRKHRQPRVCAASLFSVLYEYALHVHMQISSQPTSSCAQAQRLLLV